VRNERHLWYPQSHTLSKAESLASCSIEGVLVVGAVSATRGVGRDDVEEGSTFGKDKTLGIAGGGLSASLSLSSSERCLKSAKREGVEEIFFLGETNNSVDSGSLSEDEVGDGLLNTRLSGDRKGEW